MQDIFSKNNNPCKSLFARFHRKLCEHISIFFFSLQKEVNPKREEIITRRNADANRMTGVDNSHLEDSFIPEILPIFAVVAIKGSGAAAIMQSTSISGGEKDREKGKRMNRAVRHPAGRLSSRRQIAQMFHEIAKKSR